jgi:hypothetical protein
MRKFFSVLSLLLLGACSANKFEVQLNVKLPASVDHAVQFSVVDFNPAEKFITEADTAGINSQSDYGQKVNFIMTKWDALFKDVPPTDYWLMTNADSATYSKTGGIFIPLPADWWVASKAFLIDGKPFCYIVPLKIIKGSKISCIPGESDLVSLTELSENKIQKK